MLRFLTVIHVILALAAGEARAQNEGAQGSPPGAAELARLEFLVGSYSTSLTMPPSPPVPNGAQGTGTCVIGKALDGKFLVLDDESSLFGGFKEHGVLGYDPGTHEYVLAMFNNFGDHPSYKGSFSGDTLVLRTKVMLPGHPFDQKVVWYKDGDALMLRIFNDMGKGYALSVEEKSTPRK